jgi:hypothetical protein
MKMSMPLAPKGRFFSLSETITVAIVSSAAALIGALGSSALTLMASNDSLNQNRIQNCVQRMDKREDTLRSKGDAFLKSIASITTYAYSPLRDVVGWNERAETLMKNAFMVAVYAPEISVQTLKVSSLMRETLNVSESDNVRVYKELTTEAGLWPNLYFEVIKNIESERAKCIAP